MIRRTAASDIYWSLDMWDVKSLSWSAGIIKTYSYTDPGISYYSDSSPMPERARSWSKGQYESNWPRQDQGAKGPN